MKTKHIVTNRKEQLLQTDRITTWAVLLGALFIFNSCKKIVEIDPPKNLLVSETVFSTNETATSAMLNIYSQMSQTASPASPYYVSLYGGLSADELTSYSALLSMQQIYKNALNSQESATNGIWLAGYNFIYRANSVLEGCTLSKNLSDGVKKQLIAEAKFIRAFWNFYLVNSYGDIPLVITTDYRTNATLSRTSASLVYDSIIQDLKDAQVDLSDHYVDLNGISETQERVRPNKAAASALLARVYLYQGNSALAEAEATEVIKLNNEYQLEPLDNVFKKESKEAIWQLMVSTPTFYNTSEGFGFILTSKPSTQVIGSSAISPQLLSSFEPGDNRFKKWVSKYTDQQVTPNVDYYYPYKYKVGAGSTISEYSIVLRLAEQYLIRAEARANQGNLNGAISDIDLIRNRAGLPKIADVNPTIGKEDLLAAIIAERRIELFTEWGHRWYDLKRTAKINGVMKVVTAFKGGTWSSTNELWPIPSPDLQNDPNLKQNEGYN